MRQILVLCCVNPRHVAKVEGSNKQVGSNCTHSITTNRLIPTHNYIPWGQLGCRHHACDQTPPPLLVKGLALRLPKQLVQLGKPHSHKKTHPSSLSQLTIDSPMCSVCSPSQLGSPVDLYVINDQRICVQHLDFCIAFRILQQLQ